MLRPALVFEIVFALAFVGAASAQHWAGRGIESGLLVLALMLAPSHARRTLASADRVPARTVVLWVLEAAALVGAVFFYPVPSWSLAAAFAIPCSLAWGIDPGPAGPPRRSLGVLVLLWSLGAVISVGMDLAIDRFVPVLRILTVTVVLLETISPWRQRSDQDPLRRLATDTALMGTSLVCERAWSHPELVRVLTSALVGLPALLLLVSARPAVVDRARERRRMAARFALSVSVLIFAVGLGELAFRIVPNRYRDLVTTLGRFWHVPGKSFIYEGALLSPRQPFTNTVVWNGEGWHDVEHERTKPRGVARLLVLGDSFVEGVQVPLDSLYHRRIERALVARSERPVESIGLGWSGWGQTHELACLRKEGLTYDPDLVVCEFLPENDIRNNDDVLERLATDQSRRSTRARELFIDAASSGLFFLAFVCDHLDLAIRRLEGTLEPIDSDVYRSRPRVCPDRWTASWRLTEELLADMKAELASRGVPLLVVIFTKPLEIEACIPGAPPAPNDMDMRLPARRMTEICQRHGIACLDLAPRFARLPADVRRSLHLVNDGHWSSTGHAEAARETAAFLLDETDLWKKALEHAAR